jgi:hypothetical protein
VSLIGQRTDLEAPHYILHFFGRAIDIRAPRFLLCIQLRLPEVLPQLRLQAQIHHARRGARSVAVRQRLTEA